MSMQQAEQFMRQIKESSDPNVRYKQGRAISDIKQMLVSSAELYADNTAFWVKKNKDEEYKPITYKKTLADVEALGTALLNRGFKNKRIAVVGDNSYAWCISYLAAVSGVGVVVPLDKELPPAELMQLAVNAEVSCIFFDDKYEKNFREIIFEGGTLLKMLVNMEAEESSSHVTALKELLIEGRKAVDEGERAFTDAEIDREALGVLLFTSGTTGVSKGVMLSHKNITEDIMSAPTVLDIRDSDIFFSVLPLHHTYECTCGFLLPLYKGAAIAHCEGLKYIAKNLSEIKPTVFLGVPALFENLYRRIWKNVKKQGKDKMLRRVIDINRKTRKIGLDLGDVFLKDIRAVFGGNMRIMICGGAAINPEILQGFQDFGIMALQGYGLTECAPMGALNPDKRAKADSIGRALPNFELKIVDKDEDGIGEICVKGGNIMLGYYNMPEATAEVIRDGWFYTGDLGYIDDEGYAYITGRKKNVIITKNGKNVYPEELEYHLNKIPYILESLVYGEDAADGRDTVIVAAVRIDKEEVAEILESGYTKDAVYDLIWKKTDEINRTMPYFKKIKRLVIREDEFEKNTSKKIKRFAEGNKQG